MASRCSDVKPPRTAAPAALFLWDREPALTRQFLEETRPPAGRLSPLPPEAEWPVLPPGAGVVLAAADADALPWEAVDRLRRRHGAAVLLLLPDCDGRLWRRLIHRGLHEVHCPPFAHLDLDREFTARGRVLPLDRRLPDLDARVHTHTRFAIPADMRYMSPAVGLLCRLAREHAFPPRVWAENLPLALDEALTNAIKHGCREDAARSVHVEAWIRRDVFKVRVEDEGAGFAPDEQADPASEAGLRRPGGRGLLLMRETMDHVRFERGGRAVILYARRREAKGD
ncbi:MAG: ATP-binding protein [Candidatus Krumholzibacteriota bacterium]|nr:ATP-binding protein [Candidatus Krumholzibacteriota bacterium]